MSDRVAVMDQGEIVQLGSPMEIYDQPRTQFVASFVGNSNVLSGVVRPGANGDRRLETDSLSLPLPANFEARAGEEISLLLRPEHLNLRPMDSEQDCARFGLAGTVSFVRHLGMAIEYEVKLDSGAQLQVQSVRSRGQEPLEVGSRVCVEPESALSYLRIAHG